MRFLPSCLFALAASSFLAPNSAELRLRYGPPASEHRNASGATDSEDFMLRQGVSLTANYGPDGRACQLHVLPALDLEQPFQKYGITDEIITAVLDELLPTETRGVEFGEGTKGIFLYIEYENAVFVRRKGTWGDSEVTVSFKRDVCSKPETPFGFLPPPDQDTVLRLTPNTAELRKRFGVADSGSSTSDILIDLPDVKLAVKYGSDSRACSIEIEPAKTDNPYVPKKTVTELIDQLAPAAMRGKKFGEGQFRTSACGGVWSTGYENVAMARWPNYCVLEHPDTDRRAIIQFTRSVCPNPYVKTESKQDNSR
jgi:hypothetical protein